MIEVMARVFASVPCTEGLRIKSLLMHRVSEGVGPARIVGGRPRQLIVLSAVHLELPFIVD